MERYSLLFLSAILIFSRPFCGNISNSERETACFYHSSDINPDLERQLLLNGKRWWSQYYFVRGSEFLFSEDYLKGSITINGRTFENVDLKYDIYNDELVCCVNPWLDVQLNKERVTGFDIFFENRKYHFINITEPGSNLPQGYNQILYKGISSLYLRHSKVIQQLAVEDKYDEFDEKQILFLVKDKSTYRISGKKEFLKLTKDRDKEIRDFMKQNHIKVSRDDPYSFIPLIEFYDKPPESTH